VYAVAGVRLSYGAQVLAQTLVLGDAFASHRTAAALYGLDGFARYRPIELIIFDRRGVRSSDVLVHRPRLWLPDDGTTFRGVPVTSTRRTLFDLAAVCPERRVEIAFDDALRKRLITVEGMIARMDEVRRPGLRGLQKIDAVIADRLGNDLEDSELETIFRKLLTSHGLPLPVPQYTIWRDDGSCVGEVDFAYPNLKLAIELDSWTFHGNRRSFDDDRVEQYELFDLGWDCLRFTNSDLRRRSQRVVTVLTRRLAGLGQVQIA